MVVISDRFKYLYVAAPGAASTTTSDYLVNHCEGYWLPDEDMLDEKGNRILVQKKTFNS
jgi:hypothetical protein